MSLWWRRIRVDSAGSAFSNAGAGGATTSDSNESSIQHRGNRLERVSISIGVACYPEHGTTGEALLRSADQALYRAKEEGRDRVMMAKSR